MNFISEEALNWFSLLIITFRVHLVRVQKSFKTWVLAICFIVKYELFFFFIDSNQFQLVYVKISSGTENGSKRTRNLEVALKLWENKIFSSNKKKWLDLGGVEGELSYRWIIFVESFVFYHGLRTETMSQ